MLLAGDGPDAAKGWRLLNNGRDRGGHSGAEASLPMMDWRARDALITSPSSEDDVGAGCDVAGLAEKAVGS